MKTTEVSALIFVMALGTVAFAVPMQPHQFYGSVAINSAPAADGSTIDAKIDGITAATTTTEGGRYGYSPIFYVPDPNGNRAGRIVSFYVNGVNTGETAIFTNGLSTRVNLAITVEQLPSSGGGGGSSGGGGGGGGGLPPAQQQNTTNTTYLVQDVTQTTEPVPATGPCTERWLCTDWSSCSEGLQSRTCEDVNKCGSDLYKPMESQPCSTVEKAAPPLTAFAIADPTVIGGIIAAIVIIAAILYLVLRSRKKTAVVSAKPAPDKPQLKGKK
jgi:hypothetical protein